MIADVRMKHRHLTGQQLTLAAIDDIIARGKRWDWAELRAAALADRAVMEKILRVCQAHIADPYAQRYHFWKAYAECLSGSRCSLHLQRILPGAVLVGGTTAAIYAGHRISTDADHVLTDLRERFDQVLADLEAVAGWKTARIRRPVQILGSLDGIETGIRQLIREQPLETVQISYRGQTIRLPTEAEMLRIKAVLILRRNATRDYLDFIALADRIGQDKV